DEVIGAGDAGFYHRRTYRIRELLHHAASGLLESHPSQQIQRFCDQSMWLESGHVVMRGATTEVVKAYEKFSREMDQSWLRELQQRAVDSDASAHETTSVSEWSDVEGLRVASVRIEDENGIEQALFEVNARCTVRVRMRAEQDGVFPVVPVALIFRPDGLVMTRHVGSEET